jgi:hypothetical protein
MIKVALFSESIRLKAAQLNLKQLEEQKSKKNLVY